MHTPPNVALVLTIAFVVYLFRRDIRQQPDVTKALWIPLIWMFISMSRFVSAWLAMFGIHVGGASVEEGSPVDALGSLSLIIAGARVLVRRQINLAEIIRQNQWLALFFGWCFLAVFWSDFPFVSFKRWIKIVGEPIMVLILFTEPNFETSLIVLMKRLAYVLVPVSVCFIKYFPEYGRGFSEWTGQGYNTGITMGKNHLGVDGLIMGFFFYWYTLKVWSMEKGKFRRNELWLCALFLGMIWWLIQQAESSTSLVSMVVGILLMTVLGFKWIRRENVGTYIIAAAAILGIAEFMFGFSDLIFDFLGKDRTLTDRVYVWRDCLSIKINPIIGVGFESFWLGERQEIMNEKWYWHPNEAHNGYLEVYLNLGLIGLFIVISMMVATFWKARRELLNNFHFGRFRIAFLVALLIYNWTESSFKALHPMWIVFYMIALDYPKAEEEATAALPEELPGEPEQLDHEPEAGDRGLGFTG